MNKTYNINALPQVASELIAYAPSKIVLFYGEMGVGKTTLIKEIAKQLGVVEAMSSPTFSIVNEYQGKENKIYHFDFFRLEDETEALDIGIEDYFYSKQWVLIEWPEKINSYLPEQALKIQLTTNQNGSRTISTKPMK